MEHLFAAWSDVSNRLRQAKHVLLLTDYDGTLTPIVERPELADISEQTRRLIQTLAHQRQFTVGIISGRALADLKDRVNIAGVIYAGNHGFEIEGPGLNFVNPLAEEVRPFLRSVSQLLTLALKTTKGVFVEDKGLSLSVHYRQMEAGKVGDMEKTFQNVVDHEQKMKKFKVTSGKKVFELRPAVDWDKGKAINLLIKRFGKDGNGSGLLPIYLGDDLTDEDGFRAIAGHGEGITVHVGNDICKTSAEYFLKSTDEVLEFLKKLQNGQRRGFK